MAALLASAVTSPTTGATPDADGGQVIAGGRSPAGGGKGRDPIGRQRAQETVAVLGVRWGEDLGIEQEVLGPRVRLAA
ncbi:MAG TPA: hypothetical protein VIG69_08810, partial [Candidatus Methylomirabilis sp.]